MLVAGSVADKPSRLVAADEPVELAKPAPRFVSRGGEKLDAALGRFGIDVAGATALDAGSSTGGFADCLLQRGAARVVCVDVGRAQLHEKLRADQRVTVMEGTHILDFAAGAAGTERFDLVVADLSFISLRKVAAALVEQVKPGGDLVVLVKPQFEAGRQEASRGRGVIRDEQVWRRVLGEVISAFQDAEAAMMGVMPSPLRGADGNVEFLAWFMLDAARARAGAGGFAGSVDAAVGEVSGPGAVP